MEHHLIVRVAAKLLIPAIMLFALYVQFHGDFGPGGGFQAGVIFGAALVLYGLVFGVDRLCAVAPPTVVRILTSVGLLIYAGTGAVTLLAGGRLLEYDVLSADPVAGQHIGIVAIELGVGVAVAAVMVSLYQHFAA